MAYEVDFLAVGDGGRSGDAIAVRFGDFSDPLKQWVVVIDGGFADTGDALVEHIKTYYNANFVDLVISTHPDADHSAGLYVMLEQMKVGMLWMHQPWKHTDGISEMFRDGRVTDDGVEEKLRKALDDALDLEKLARRRGVPIYEPFTGLSAFDGRVLIAGPTQKFYESLLPDFRCTPEAKRRSQLLSLLKALTEKAGAMAESLGIETLRDEGDPTSAENNSSAIVLIRPSPATGLLFTGDAGIPALTEAADHLDACGIGASFPMFIQVPHHGSRRNVGPTILNRLVGPKLSQDTTIKTAFVSAAKDGAPKHPAKKVTNAFRRRGAPVHATQGEAKCYRSLDAPDRGWGTSTPLPLYTEVDE